MVFYCEITEMRNLCFVLICLSVRRSQTTIDSIVVCGRRIYSIYSIEYNLNKYYSPTPKSIKH